jgi:uncharacterized protein YjiS (DUF1127 family)
VKEHVGAAVAASAGRIFDHGQLVPQKEDSTTERMMTTISCAPTLSRSVAKRSWATRLAGMLTRWWIGYATWRIERAAIRQLWAMSDRELKDIGLTRSEIPNARRDHAVRAREFRRNYW